ncbi:uncharacterized protein [Dermacentor andersoni]|uniref:uncharacterized protein n=1 Tax=Dermacentor andersoni TaxID=34620 RepID=UPI002416DE10|nr:uncharacterized protein LOC129384130 [Dermacentor andersoni]
MATLTSTMSAGAALLFAALALGKGADDQSNCDMQRKAACYWSVAEKYGIFPLAQEVVYSVGNYLGDLCTSNPDTCYMETYSSCTNAEKNKFTRMERGYAVLREEITSPNCQSVVTELRKCINLSPIRNCDVKPDSENRTFEAQVEERQRVAQNVKACLEEAVKPCNAKENTDAIAHLQKIADAIVDLSSLSDEHNAAHTTKAATAVVAVSLLSWVVGNFY